MTLSRYVHTGAAPATGLASGISSSATSFTVLSGTGYPSPTAGQYFVVCIDAGTTSEEKILCSARSGTAFTVASGGRGYDGTAAASHSAGTTNVTHVLSAAEVDDTSDHIYNTTRNDHTQYVEGAATPGGDLAGSGSTYTAPVLKTSGVTAGTYTSVTVNAKGLVTAGSSGNGLLEVVKYNPGTAISASTTLSTWSAIDSTNLTASFTAPSSGQVLIRLTANITLSTNGVRAYWGLLTHGTTTLVSDLLETQYSTTGGGEYLTSVVAVISGLTSGNSYQYDWGFATSGGTFYTIYGGGSTVGSGARGPATMEVWSA